MKKKNDHIVIFLQPPYFVLMAQLVVVAYSSDMVRFDLFNVAFTLGCIVHTIQFVKLDSCTVYVFCTSMFLKHSL
jgi:hypothetical protein